MAGGQAMDLEAERARFDLATVTRLQGMKTGALIGAAVEAGLILGRVPPEARTPLRGYARDIGLAFQIADDLIDATGDEDVAGKKLRKDGTRGKETFLTLLGLERARAPAAMLVDQAIAHLRGHGPESDVLPSELQSPMRTPYAAFCSKHKTNHTTHRTTRAHE